MDFMFSWQEQYLTRSLRSLVRYKIHIFSQPCNILYIRSSISINTEIIAHHQGKEKLSKEKETLPQRKRALFV